MMLTESGIELAITIIVVGTVFVVFAVAFALRRMNI
jgi:hypothetical protein